MRKWIVVTVLLVLGVSALAGTELPCQDPNAGRTTVFRTLAWGDPPACLGDYYEISEETDVGLKVYRKRNEELMLGPMKVKQIKYYFFDNRLYRIVVTTDAEYEDILAMLMAKYGNPDREPLFSHTREWTRGDTFIQSVWPIFGDKFFKLESLSLKDDYKMWVEEYKRQMAKEAASSW